MEANYMSRWKPIFSGTYEDRPVVLEEWDDGDGRSLRVVTNYGKDQLLGDGIPDVIPAPVGANDTMHVEAATVEELEINLMQEGEFSPASARDIARHARRPA